MQEEFFSVNGVATDRGRTMGAETIQKKREILKIHKSRGYLNTKSDE